MTLGYGVSMALSALVDRIRANRWSGEIALVAAVTVAATLGVWSELVAAPHPYPAAWGAFVLAIVTSGILLLRRSVPVIVAMAAILLVLLYHLLGYPGEAPGIVFFVAFYSVACYGRGTRSLLIGLGLALVATVIPILPPHPLPFTSFAVVGPTAGFAWMVVVGAAAGQRRRAQDTRVAQAARDAEARIRDGLVEERLHIARDLHDVLAHTLSAISVQSGVAIDSLPDRPNAALDAIRSVRSLAKEAIPELRVTLTALRGSDEPQGDVAPQPRLSELAAVADRARQTGLSVSLTLPDDLSQLSRFSEVTAYRIVQESVTNVIRHAEARSVEIAVAVAHGVVTIDVIDDGAGGTDGAGGVGAGGRGGTGGQAKVVEGLGIRGMRERAELVGGTLSARRDGRGGFHVHAELPVASE